MSLWNRQRNVSCKWKQNSFPLSIDFDHLPKILPTMLIFKSYQIHRNLNKKISIDIKSSCKRLINQDVLHWSKLRVFRNHNNVSSVKTWHKNQYEDLTLLQYGYEWGHGQSMTHILILSIWNIRSVSKEHTRIPLHMNMQFNPFFHQLSSQIGKWPRCKISWDP